MNRREKGRLKVAILNPKFMVEEGKRGSQGTIFLASLIKRIKELYENTLFTVEMGKPSEISSDRFSLPTLQSLHTFFSKAEGFDLILNPLGILPLLMYPNPSIPVLTLFHTLPTDTEIAFVETASPLFFFASLAPTKAPENPNFLGSFSSEEITNQLPRLIEKIHVLTAREDHRPWGYYVVLADEEDHKVKRITVWPGKRLSLQRHQRRSEHWHIIQGKAIVTLDDRQIPLEVGKSVDIPRGVAHRIQNPGMGENLVFIEVQRGDYFGEDDIERLEDDYGRT